MNNVKIIYYNADTIDVSSFESSIVSNANTVSHYIIKPGLMFINYKGTSRELYICLGDMVKDRSILIHDLDSDMQSYYGFMNKEIWKWLAENRK